MSLGYKGGIISATPPTTTGGPSGTASGIWSLQTQLQAIANGDWPTAPILYSLYTWGLNNYGELGVGNPRYWASVTQVTGTTDWASIAANESASFVAGVKTDGTLWTWGNNNYGQLGHNDVVNRNSPTQVGAGTTWSKVVLSAASIIALKTDGTVWSWGINTYGQLGHGDTVDKSSPVQISSLSAVSDIAASVTGVFVLFLKSNGLVYSCGYNNYGQLGIGDVLPRSAPVQINTLSDINFIAASKGGYFAAAIDVTNQVLMWGRNNQGQLGIENIITYNTPQGVAIAANKIALGQDHTVARKTDGTLWGWGDGASYVFANGATTDYSSPIQIGSDTDWVDVYANSSVTGAIKTNGTVWAIGTPGSGQLGNGTFYYPNGGLLTELGQVLDITSPAMVVPGQSSTHFLVGNTWYATGDGEDLAYNLFSLDLYYKRSSPVQLGANKNWKGGSISQRGALYIDQTGALYGTGGNENGCLGLNSLRAYVSPVQVGSLTDWQQVSLESAAGAIKTDGTLWTWGLNSEGALGQNDLVNRSSPVQVGTGTNWAMIFIGPGFAAAIKTDGTLWTWGSNNAGRLGLNNVVNSSSPVQVGSLTDWASVVCGETGMLALKTDGTLWAWGNNDYGELAQNNLIARSSPVQIGSGTNWATIGASGWVRFGTLADGTMYGWGRNYAGAVGDNTEIDRSSPVQIGTSTDWAAVYGTSDGTFGAGKAIKTNGTLWAWGVNSNGNLGTNDTESRSSPVQVGSLTSWSFVSGGASGAVSNGFTS